MLCYYLLLPWSSNLPFTYSMAYSRTFLLHSTAKTQKSQTQKEESFTRKSPFLKHQEKFSKDSPYDKIFVKHSAQSVQRDWRSPFAVLNLQDSKRSTIFLNYMIFLKRSFRSSTLASFGFPGAHASAWADSARN